MNRICHAKTYQFDDLTASAQTVRAAGGTTCLRCHTNHPGEDVHTVFGLACVSCHIADGHQIQKEVSCQTCHTTEPHKVPLLNVIHARMDCLTCHVTGEVETIVDTTKATQNLVTQFFEPAIEPAGENIQLTWQLPDGQPATIGTENAQITLATTRTILAPAFLDTIEYAQTGTVAGQSEQTAIQVKPSHDIFKAKVRQCNACHGEKSSFDYVSLGYDEERARKLSGK